MRVLGIVLLAATAVFAAKNNSQVTFYKDVLPVLQKNCQGCHRPGEAAPMSFLTYESTRPWAKAMREAVASKRMPPWFADPAHGKWANDRSLSEAEIQSIVSWAEAGAAAGNAKQAPPSRNFIEGWNIGNPDLVVEMKTDHPVQSAGTIEYTYFVIPLNLTEDKWVQMAEIRPGNRPVVHHVIAFIRQPGSKWMREAAPYEAYIPKKRPAPEQVNSGSTQTRQQEENSFGGEWLTGYAPGTVPDVLKTGQGRLIKAGSDIVLQMHYTANGKEATDRTKVGLIFAKEPPNERVMTLAATTSKFVIPAGAPNHQVESAITLHADSKLVAMLPHMHLRGKDFEYRVIYPTGEKQTILSVPRYSFSWQLSYFPIEPLVLPKGTRIECTAHYDNSANNPHNPDSKVDVRYGDQSWEEMMFGFFDVAIDVKMNPADLMRAPKPARSGD
jgi:hypothetical protein